VPHPSLGLPPVGPSSPHADAAARLRDHRVRLARVALDAAMERDPKLREKYDDVALREMLRDYERHIEQLALALETGVEAYVVNYGEWLVPIYRRRKIPMRDFATMLLGLRDAAATVVTGDDATELDRLIDRWRVRLKRHAGLPGDHKGNPIVRFFWKAAGIADDKI
jgi:hypothetical protein